MRRRIHVSRSMRRRIHASRVYAKETLKSVYKEAIAHVS
jgi:hypothetical protein